MAYRVAMTTVVKSVLRFIGDQRLGQAEVAGHKWSMLHTVSRLTISGQTDKMTTVKRKYLGNFKTETDGEGEF